MALTRDTRNALDNPTSALDLLDPFPLFPSSHPIVASYLSAIPANYTAIESACDDPVISDVSNFHHELSRPFELGKLNFRPICIFNDCTVLYI